MKLTINDKEYNVLVAKTEDEQETGLQNVQQMDDDEGMLFIYDYPQDIDFWMKDTDIPLDIIFIDENWKVISVQEGVPNTEDLISESNVQYVLELNKNSNISEGDIIYSELNESDDNNEEDYEDEEDEDEDEDESYDVNKMYIIGSDGEPQMEIVGGERIFSRPDTKSLIRLAKKAYKNKTDKSYKKLGETIFKYIDIQNNNEPEYVETKKG